MTVDSMAKHLLHLGLMIAVVTLALKAALMPPRLQASLRPGESAMLGDDVLALKSFTVPKYADGKPRQYVSDVHVLAMKDGNRPKAVHATISVNHPMRWRGWWIYQSAYDAAQEEYTVLEAVHDPLLPLAAVAGALLLVGAALLCRGEAGAVGEAAFPTAHPGTQTRKRPNTVLFSALKFAAATAVVMLPLWIVGRALLMKELVPALQSPLLVPHVGAYLVSYAILIFAAFGIGVRLVPFGFFLMTLALVLGAVWGKICWGDWWQYDPKEMWSLATWLTFAAYFHFRHRACVARWVLRLGAVMIILTLTWVNFARVFKGLHSYV